MATREDGQITTCCWIVGETGKPCGKPTPYTMEKLEDGSKRRLYAHWCNEHKAKAEAQQRARMDEEEEEDAPPKEPPAPGMSAPIRDYGDD